MAQAKSSSGRHTNKFLLVFFTIFLAAGSLFFWFVFLSPVLQIWNAVSWVETQCTVISSSVGTHQGDDSVTYSIDISFKYKFEGQEYTSDRYKFATISSSGIEPKQRVVDEYPVGTITSCYVNPNQPAQAVINREFTSDLWFGLLPVVFILVGAGGLLTTTGVIRFTRAEKYAQVEPAEDGQLPSGEVILRPQNSATSKLVVAILVALFWNAIVGAFLSAVVHAHIQGRPDWMMTIFVIPFVVVGLGLIGFLGYRVFAFMTPRPILTLSQVKVCLGQSVTLSWRFSKSHESLRDLKIVLHGTEVAQAFGDGETIQKEHVFFEQTLVDTNHPMPTGQTEWSTPADTMHSFESDSNEIAWTLRVTADVRTWPDIKDDFPVLVLPNESN